MTRATDRRSISQHGVAGFPASGGANLAANTVIKKGWHVAKNSSGWAVEFITGTGLVSEGIAAADADSTGLADGALTIPTYGGIHDQENSSAGDALADGDAPCVCYVVDNQTVAKTSNGGLRSIAGVFLGINPETSKPRVGVGRAWAAIADGLAADVSGQIVTGSGTLVAGLATIANTNVTAGSKIFLSRKVASATALGELTTPTQTAGTGFTVAAKKPADGTTETADISTFVYLIVG